jgi:von Willebrand factor type A domain
MRVVWLTPTAALVALAAILPVLVWLAGERRVRRVRETLGLAAPLRGTLWAPAAIALTLGLVAVAAAQPVLASAGGEPSLRTGEVFVVVDTSTSMRAGDPTRYTRAAAAAERLRDDLPGTPVGLASLTDRVLPHVFPTIDRDDYLATLDESMGVDKPPPARIRRQASGFDALTALATSRFFTNTIGRRVAILLTDGESREFNAGELHKQFAQRGIGLVVVRFWNPGERIAGDAVYRADPSSLAAAQTLAVATGGRVYEENELDAAATRVRALLGRQQARKPPKGAVAARPLAPYAMAAALVPLGLLLWRRNVR